MQSLVVDPIPDPIPSLPGHRLAPVVSVVIPTLNEQGHLGSALESTRRDRWGLTETIVVDAASTDGTVEVARGFGARVVVSPPGRARQMNAGAAAAQGRVLVFLHADTQLPQDYDQLAWDTLTRRGVAGGAFRLRIDAGSVGLRIIEWSANQRSRWLGLPYGDQGLFVGRHAFRKIGGFADQPVMEDVDLVCRLRRLGRVALADGRVVTSARRWQRHGLWRTTVLHQWMIIAYGLGVSLDRIAAWRGGGVHGVAVHDKTAHGGQRTARAMPGLGRSRWTRLCGAGCRSAGGAVQNRRGVTLRRSRTVQRGLAQDGDDVAAQRA